MSEANQSSEAPLTVRAVTMLTGINEHTLRAWERRYGAVSPERTASGRRYYTRRDVERLRVLAGLVGRGYPIGQIASLADPELFRLKADSLALQQADGATTPLPTVSVAHADLVATLKVIAQATASYDLARAHEEMLRARTRYGVRAFALEVISPLMGTVDQLIMRGEFSIAQEHALSAIVRANLLEMLMNLSRVAEPAALEGSARPRSFAIATMEGDLHEIGILISAVLCAYHGCAPSYIGPNMPPDSLAVAAAAMGVDVVLLGVTPLPPGESPHTLTGYLTTLAAHLPPSCEIWVGGSIEFDPKNLKLGHMMRRIETLSDLDRLLAAIAEAGQR